MIRRTRGDRRGLTLIEVLLAASMLVALLVATQQVLVQTRKLARAAETGFDHDRRLIRLARRLEAAIAGASPYRGLHEDADFRGDGEDLRFSTRDFLVSREGRAALRAQGFLGDGTGSRGEGPGDGLDGVDPGELLAGRLATLHLGEDGDGVFLEVLPLGWLQKDPSESRGRYVERLEGLTDLELAYHDGHEWKEEWSLRRTLDLPRAVRLRAMVRRERPGGFGKEPFAMIVPIPVRRDVTIQ